LGAAKGFLQNCKFLFKIYSIVDIRQAVKLYTLSMVCHLFAPTGRLYETAPIEA